MGNPEIHWNKESNKPENLKTRVHFCIMYETSAYCIKPKKAINHVFKFAKSLIAALTALLWLQHRFYSLELDPRRVCAKVPQGWWWTHSVCTFNPKLAHIYVPLSEALNIRLNLLEACNFLCSASCNFSRRRSGGHSANTFSLSVTFVPAPPTPLWHNSLPPPSWYGQYKSYVAGCNF